MFVNTRNFDDCDKCIQAIQERTTTIGCYTTGGSEPVTVHITIAQRKKQGYSNGGAYITRWQIDERYHMKDVKCEVSNIVLTTPIVASTKLYVTQRPGEPVLNMTLVEGQHIDVSCISKGGRPAANVSMYISGTPVTSYSWIQGVQTNTLDSSSTFTSTTVPMFMNFMTRKWNGGTIKCCVSHVMLEQTICTYRPINYKFPPASVKIQTPPLIIEDRPYHLLNVTCLITNANPPCPAVWSFQDMEVMNVINHTQKTQDNGYTTTNVAVVNVSKADSGYKIECRASCNEFKVEIYDNYQLYVPYAPRIEVNVSTSTVNMTEGSTIVLQCTAKSDPVSTISWITSNSNSSFTELACGGSGTMCMRIKDIKLGDSGLYTCRADNSLFGTKTKDIEIKAIEHPQDYDQENNSDNEQSPGPIVWSVVGASVFAVVCITLGFVIKRAVRKTADDMDRAGDLNCSAQFAENNDSDVNRTPGNATAAFAFNDDEGPTYATVIPLSQRHAIPSDKHEALKSNQTSKELIYADLDLQPSRSGIRRRPDSPTEYVSIDFTKKFQNYQCDSST